MIFAGLDRLRAIRPLSLKIGLALAVVVVAATLLAMVWTPQDPLAQDATSRLMGPSPAHLLGTDALGRDVLSLVMAGAANSLGVAGAGVVIGLLFGVPLGLWAASRKGVADDLIMRGGDLIFAFPSLLTAVMLAAATGPSALNAGRSNLSISIQHILPHVLGLLSVQAAVQFAVGVAAEAGLSYLGLGAQPPAPSWGRMLAESQTLIGTAPWLAIFPGLAIFVTVLALSLLGDGLRDRLDPRLRREV